MSTAQDFQDLLTQARRIAFGTAASLLEMLQDPHKREQNFKKISEDFNQIANELAVKGEETEMEARRYVDSWWEGSKAGSGKANSAPTKIEVVDITNETSSPSEVEELNEQIRTLKAELEELRKSAGNRSTGNGSSADNTNVES